MCCMKSQWKHTFQCLCGFPVLTEEEALTCWRVGGNRHCFFKVNLLDTGAVRFSLCLCSLNILTCFFFPGSRNSLKMKVKDPRFLFFLFFTFSCCFVQTHRSVKQMFSHKAEEEQQEDEEEEGKKKKKKRSGKRAHSRKYVKAAFS